MEKKNLYPTTIKSLRHLKLLLAGLMIYLIPSGAFAQNTDLYKSFINKSSIAVFEAQKAMISNNKTNADGKLAKLVALQMNAVVLFNKKQYAQAAYYSNLSRLKAIELITSLNGTCNKFYVVSDNEKALFENAAVENEVDLQARENISQQDQDYLNPNSIQRSKVEIQ